MLFRLAAFPTFHQFPPILPAFYLVSFSRFHTSSRWTSDNGNFYETLGLQPDASAASIKKQFYSLSKLHHPDRNPSDPNASSRFMKISSAYATLGVPSKREKYDREHFHTTSPSSSSSSPTVSRQGSHSSASSGGPFGSRPASGLSRRRTQFKGPPPSFYKSGGWGAQGAKRAQAQQQGSTASSSSSGDGSGVGSSSSSSSTSSSEPGMGPGQSPLGWENDVPHFDREVHFRTQEQQDLRRRRRMEESGGHDHDSGGDVLLKFIVVSGVVLVACALPGMFAG